MRYGMALHGLGNRFYFGLRNIAEIPGQRQLVFNLPSLREVSWLPN
jgi:hypothetical protein